MKENDEDKKFGQIASTIEVKTVEDFLHENYLPYAYYVIRNRALVGVDGLKPVNRRILYSMYLLKLGPSSKTIKAQMILGDVMGKYHPHGDSGISGGMSHMAQDFATRVRLIEPEGSVGYSTGDRAAAPRYWEARLTKPAMELLRELDDNVLPMGKNYDDTLPEPAILPVRWPVTIINGTDGIAVGYASTIFPNNPDEAMDVAIALLKNPDLTIDEVVKIMPGPDFPTGGELIGAEGIKEMYATGKGSFILRGRYTTKQLTRGRTEISFYEFPFQVSAENVTSRIQKLQKDGKLTEISSIGDFSGKSIPVKYNIVLKPGSNVSLVLNDLFSMTPLSIRLTSNNTVLDDGMPVKKGIISLFNQFLDLRKECTRNRNVKRIRDYNEKIHQNDGLIKILIDIDKVINIIRNSETSDSAKILLKKEFKIDDNQAEYVLSLQLRKLTKSNREELISHNNDLKNELAELNKIETNPQLFAQEIINDLLKTKAIIHDKRRTVIVGKTLEEVQEHEKNVSKMTKAVNKLKEATIVQFADNSLYKGETIPSIKDMLPIKNVFKMAPDDDLFALMNDGKGIKIPTSYLPFNKVVSYKTLDIKSDEKFVALGKTNPGKKDCGLLIVLSDGRVANSSGRIPSNSSSFSVIQTNEAKVVTAKWTTKQDLKESLAMVTNDGLIARIPLKNIRITGYGSQGIKGMNVNADAEIVNAFLMNKQSIVVSLTPKSIKTTLASEIPERNRGAKGVLLHRLGKRSGGEITDAFGSENPIMTDKLGIEMTIPEASPRAASGVTWPTLGLLIGSKNMDNTDINDN